MTRFERRRLSELDIEDDRELGGIGLYRDLKAVLARADYRFTVAEGAPWPRVLFLNLTFWAGETDLIEAPVVPADVVAHAGWHFLARRELKRAGARGDGDALLLGEAIASAFDLYLVGRLVELSPECGFLATQVPALREAAEAAGVGASAFEALLAEVVRAPERAFEDLRQLLFDAAGALVGVGDPLAAAACLDAFDGHRFASLLHHYELSNWILHVRALAGGQPLGPDPVVRAVDAELRAAPDALAWLEARWLVPSLSDR